MKNKILSIGTLIALAATGLFLCVLTSSTIISAAVLSTRSISSGGKITSLNVEIYSNIECTIGNPSIEWGELDKGGTSSVTIYIRNEGESPQTLSLVASDWTPSSAENYLSISWNYNNQPLNPDSVVEITLTLSVDPQTQGIDTFGVNLLIVGNY